MAFDNSTEVVDRVVEALKSDPRTKGCHIDVANERGIVSLRGVVPNGPTREVAEQLARQQGGVITVINEISVS
jgi:osmotically-inducible protein OsmY